MTIFYWNKGKRLQMYFGMVLAICVAALSWYLGMGIAEEESVLAQPALSMYSGSYALMDGDTGRVLVGKQQTNPMANASTTKILTCIVTLENCDLDEVVSVSANAAAQPKVHYGMKEGEQYPLRELLYGLMLESFNDCAVAIAEHVAGSEAAFAEMLNAKAKEIGCKDTYFITPNGLDAENESGFHHTTAEDLCRIMAYCTWESQMKDVFLEITQTRSWGPFVNRNAFLDQMDGVLSGKTGFTSKAGYCYVAALEQGEERYTIALLACGWPNNKTYKWKDAKQLFTYGLETYDKQEIVLDEISEELKMDAYINVPEFYALNKTSAIVLATEKRSYHLLMTVKERLRIEKIIYEDIQLPVEKGAVLGECNIYLGDVKIDSVPIISEDFADSWRFKDIAVVIFRQFFSATS